MVFYYLSLLFYIFKVVRLLIKKAILQFLANLKSNQLFYKKKFFVYDDLYILIIT